MGRPSVPINIIYLLTLAGSVSRNIVDKRSPFWPRQPLMWSSSWVALWLHIGNWLSRPVLMLLPPPWHQLLSISGDHHLQTCTSSIPLLLLNVLLGSITNTAIPLMPCHSVMSTGSTDCVHFASNDQMHMSVIVMHPPWNLLSSSYLLFSTCQSSVLLYSACTQLLASPELGNYAECDQ